MDVKRAVRKITRWLWTMSCPNFRVPRFRLLGWQLGF